MPVFYFFITFLITDNHDNNDYTDNQEINYILFYISQIESTFKGIILSLF